MTEAHTPVDVAAGVLIRPDGRFLLASRPAGKPYASYWEFPGGKVEPDEPIAEALRRELLEELAIEIGPAFRWVTRVFDYPHALVRLHFCRVFEWQGELQARENQQFDFFSPGELPDGPLLPATVPVLKWLQLPSIYAISAAARLGPDVFLRCLDSALRRGLELLQFREPELDTGQAAAIFRQVLDRVRAAGAIVLVNSRHARALWDQADGVHLTAADLSRAQQRPGVDWVAASTHSSAEVQRATQLGVDFIVTGPVLPTATHSDRPPLGWDAFEALIAATSVPAYALGGLQMTNLSHAIRRGAHGIALLSAAWSSDQCFGAVDAPAAMSGAASMAVADPAIE